jgi:bifunctional DNA-binding transcriptional regulator/antitoxin component of YhaV-PrlF toxin-antitoxin module
MNKSFKTTVEYSNDSGEYYITLPDELLSCTGWEEGDMLDMVVNKDGSVLIEHVDTEFGGTDNDED